MFDICRSQSCGTCLELMVLDYMSIGAFRYSLSMSHYAITSLDRADWYSALSVPAFNVDILVLACLLA